MNRSLICISLSLTKWYKGQSLTPTCFHPFPFVTINKTTFTGICVPLLNFFLQIQLCMCILTPHPPLKKLYALPTAMSLFFPPKVTLRSFIPANKQYLHHIQLHVLLFWNTVSSLTRLPKDFSKLSLLLRGYSKWLSISKLVSHRSPPSVGYIPTSM